VGSVLPLRQVGEQRVIGLRLPARLTAQELRGLQAGTLAVGRALWASSDSAKGGRERWVPVLSRTGISVAVDRIRWSRMSKT
jgi:hypothetical protein